jgi:hypothetical protein
MLTADELRTLLEYEPVTGILRWREPPNRRIQRGSAAGTMSRGYVWVRLNGKRYAAHRLAWFYMTGEWPKADIDHRNCRRDDNSWANLRAASRMENARNMGVKRNGLKGVAYDRARQRFMARIKVRGQTVYLGRFSTEKEAHAAYAAAANRLFGQFARAA